MDDMIREKIVGFERRLERICSTQKELTRRAGVGKTLIGQWRKFAHTGEGRRPKFEKVKLVDETLEEMEKEFIAFHKKRPPV